MTCKSPRFANRFAWRGRRYASGSAKRARPSHYRLAIEPLESRHLLTTFFVADPQYGGDDMNPGSDAEHPWATIDRVNSALAGGELGAGDKVCFHRGDTFAGNLILNGVGGGPGNPLTIADYGSDPNAPKIDAGDGTGISVQNAGHVEIADLEIAGSYDPVLPSSSNGNGIEFINTTTAPFSEIAVHDVMIHGFSNDPAVDLFGRGCGILIAGTSAPDTGYLYDTITVSRCDIWHTVRAGVETLDPRRTDPEAHPPVFAHVHIDHVDAHDILPPVNRGPTGVAQGNGIVLIGVEDAVVERCRAFDNGSRLLWETGVAIWTYHSNHVLFQFNEAYGNRTQPAGDEGGFDFDRWTTNSIMQYNYSHDNDGYGYMLGSLGITEPMAEHNIVRFNISQVDSRNTDYGALLFEDWAASDIEVYNNTFSITDNGLPNEVPAAIRFQSDQHNMPAPTIHVYNNILLTSSPSVPVVYVDDVFDLSGLTFAGNDYFSNAQGTIQIRWGPGETFDTLGEFRNATGQEQYGGLPVGTCTGPGLMIPEPARTIGQVDQMATELMPAYQLAVDAPDVLKTGGVDLSAPDVAGPGWWAPDEYWSTLLDTPKDFFGAALPSQSAGTFGMGVGMS